MATPPRIDRREIDAALARIGNRRIKIGDESWSAVDQESPAAVLDYLLDHPPRGAVWVKQADVNDGLVLNIALWWEDRRRELRLLKRGVAEGIPRAQLGSARGIGSQGIQDRIDALEALLERGRPDAKIIRLRRALDKELLATATPRERWLHNHYDWISETAGNLVAHANDIANDDTYAVLLEVKRDLRDDTLSSETITMMALTVEYLRAQPEVIRLGGQHRLKRSCAAVDDLHRCSTHLIDRIGSHPARATAAPSKTRTRGKAATPSKAPSRRAAATSTKKGSAA
jgi:hypothetical protein